jgi:hypothetical protein
MDTSTILFTTFGSLDEDTRSTNVSFGLLWTTPCPTLFGEKTKQIEVQEQTNQTEVQEQTKQIEVQEQTKQAQEKT